jgi:hypothetical protein
MCRTLIILLAETRAHELTYDNIKKNLIDTLNADLCLCIGVKPDYDYNNPFYKLAKYKFTYEEPDDYGDAFEYAYNILKNELPEKERNNLLYWREFLKIKEQYMGGVKDSKFQHDGSAGILIFFRWYLLKCLQDNNLIQQYDRFIITRSDFIYRLPHPTLDILKEDYIWIPDCEHYGGYTDRHVVLSQDTIIPYLNIFNNMVHNGYDYYLSMCKKNDWCLERLIPFHLKKQNVLYYVKEFPYVMYSVRPEGGTTRWSSGIFSNQHNYYIKYPSEYEKSSYYAELYNKTSNNINEFYRSLITY